MLATADVAARALGVRLQFVEARGPEEFARAFSDMSSAVAGALTVLPSNRFQREHKRLADLAAKNRLPAVYTSREFVDAGGLTSYGTNSADCIGAPRPTLTRFSRARSPAISPSSSPPSARSLNLKTAKALGLAIPQSVLAHADDVIQ